MKRNLKLGMSTMIVAIGFASVGTAQDRDSRDRHGGGDQITRIEEGTNIVVRTSQSIDSDRRDNRVYLATVDRDVRARNGRVAIPRGSKVELVVRVTRDNSLILDLQAVTVRDQRYGIDTDPNRVQAQNDENNLVGAIIGAITGGQASGHSVHVRRGTVLTFRLERPLSIRVADHDERHDGNR